MYLRFQLKSDAKKPFTEFQCDRVVKDVRKLNISYNRLF